MTGASLPNQSSPMLTPQAVGEAERRVDLTDGVHIGAATRLAVEAFLAAQDRDALAREMQLTLGLRGVPSTVDDMRAVVSHLLGDTHA
jgi:hypothetical protein